MTSLDNGSLLRQDPSCPAPRTRRMMAVLVGLATIALLGFLDYTSGPPSGP